MKREQKHTGIFVLLMLIFALTVTGCAQTGAPSSGQEDASSTETGGEAETGIAEGEFVPTEPAEPLVIASNGASDFTVWYADGLGTDTAVMEAVERVVKSIRNQTGADVECLSDADYEETSDAGRPGIVIGRTVLPETGTAEDLGLKSGDYYVGCSGNRIVVYASNNKKCIQAVNYLVNKVFRPQDAEDGTLVFTAENSILSRQSGYGIDSILCLGAELMKYQIVLPTEASVNEIMLARNLRYYLTSEYGYELEMVTDDAAEAPWEILVGNTSRSAEDVKEGTFAVSVRSDSEGTGKLELLAADMPGYLALYDYLTETLLPSGKNAVYELDADDTCTGEAPADTEDASAFASTRYGDIRCMFYNVYYYDSSMVSEDLRRQLQLELIGTYQPDVIGFQEFGSRYHDKLTPMLNQAGYEEVSAKTEGNNWTPLFYRSDVLEEVESGYILYDGANDSNSKSLTWAVLREKETKKMFVAIGTHFMWNQPGTDGNEARLTDAEQMLGLIQTISGKSAYRGIPVVMGGDLNCGRESEPVQKLIDGGLKLAWDLAETKNDSRGEHGYPAFDEASETYTEWNYPTAGYMSSIDHICVNDQTTVKAMAAVLNMYSMIASDHVPELVDIALE